MNKNVIRIFSVLLLVIMMVSVGTMVFADEGQLKPGDITADYSGIDTADITSTAKKIVGFIRNIAVIAGVIILTWLGIKYMLGSVEEKADYKKSLLPLVIGIVVVMASTQIATMIFSLF